MEVETNVLKAAQSAGIEAALLGNPDVTVVERQNLTGKRDDGSEDPNPSAVRVALTTHRLGDFGLSVVASKRFECDLDGAHVTVYAPRPQGIDIQEDVRESEAKDGMDLRRVLRFTTDPATAWASTLWIEATEDAAAPGHDLGGLVCRVMEGEDLKDEVFGKKGTDGLAEIASNKAYALLWDSGYRDQTVEAAGVTFEGSMPEGAWAEARDVTGDYGDASEVTGEKATVKEAPKTLAAYDLSLHANDAVWQPTDEHRVTARISDDAIDASDDIRVWRLADGADPAPVDVVGVEDGSVTFAMEGEGTYILVGSVSLEHEFVTSDGETYRVSVSYDGTAGLPQNVELVVREAAQGGIDYLEFRQSTNVGVLAESELQKMGPTRV